MRNNEVSFRRLVRSSVDVLSVLSSEKYHSYENTDVVVLLLQILFNLNPIFCYVWFKY